MENEVRAQSITLENIKGLPYAELRLRKLPPGQGQLVLVYGANGAGKSSLLEGIGAIFAGGHNPSLIRDGCDKAEATMTLSDGTIIKRVVTRKGYRLDIKTADDVPVKAPESYVKKLASGFSFDPISFCTAKKEDRLKYLLQVMPMDFPEMELVKVAGAAMKVLSPNGISLAGSLDINGINRLIKDMIEKRGSIGSRRDEKANSVETFRKSLLKADQGDEPRDWKKELAALEANKAVIDKEEREDVADIEGRLREIRDRASSKITKLDSDARDEFSRLLSVARYGTINDTPENTSGKLFNILSTLSESARDLAEAAKEAQAAIDKIRAENSTALQGMAASIEAAKAGAEAQTKDSGIREEMERLRGEVKTLSKDWDAIAAGIKGLEELRRSKLKELPVDGLEVMDDGSIQMHGRDFDQWNAGQQYLYSMEIGCCGPGDLNLLICDTYEHLDTPNQKMFEEAVVASGKTVIAARVATEEELKRIENSGGSALRSEPAQALVMA